MTSIIALVASTALIMGGTQHPLSNPPDSNQFISDYIAGANNNYIAPSGLCPGTCTLVAVVTPEQFCPQYGTMTYNQSVAQGVKNLDTAIGTTPHTPGTDTIVVYGYSQSAVIASIEKTNLANNPTTANLPVSFILIANPNRPNGGVLERFNGAYIPILDVSFNGATPTNTNFTTVDVARQYDGWADFPTNPLNVLADANAIAGIYYLHGNYYGVGTPVLQDKYGDTTYYLIPTKTLPLLMPVAQVPLVGPIVADTLDPALRVLVEAGYNRTVSPGAPTTANFLYFPNPVALGVNLVVAIPTGVDNGLADVGVGRALGTAVPGPYGVGGPPVTLPQQTTPGPPTPYAPVQTTTTNTPQQASTTNPNTTDNSSQVSSTQTQPTTTPNPLAPLVTLPEPAKIIRGPMTGSPSLPGAKDVASSVKAGVKQVTTAATGAINGVTSAVKSAATAAGGGTG